MSSFTPDKKYGLLSVQWKVVSSREDLEELGKSAGEDKVFLVKDFSNPQKITVKGSLVYDLPKFIASKTKSQKTDHKNQVSLLIQPFSTDLLLWDDNCRCDLRCFVLVVSVDPLKTIFVKGYLQKASSPFDPTKRLHRMAFSTDLEDQILHPDFESIKSQLQIPISQFEEKAKTKIDLSKFWTTVQDSARSILETWTSSLPTKRKNTFSILAIDYLLGSDLMPRAIHKVSLFNKLCAKTSVTRSASEKLVQLTIDHVLAINAGQPVPDWQIAEL